MRFWRGETVRVSIAFTDAAGEPVPATGVAVQWRRDGGVPVSVPSGEILADGAGRFRADIVAAEAEEYAVRATCLAPTGAATEAGFTVLPGAFS